MSRSPLDGRIGLVTGASRGLGRAIAMSLATAGADVAVTYLEDAKSMKETQRRIEALGRRVLVGQVDVRDYEQVADFTVKTCSELGTPDICVSNAGVPSPGVVAADTDPADFKRVLEVHLMGGFNCARAVIPAMRKSGCGTLIFISSEVTRKTPRGRGPYTVGKAGIEALARTIAGEEREHGIRVNCIAPGVINTGYAITAARRRGFETVEELCATMPFGRLIDPAEIGQLCVFLASEGNYITGEVIYVNGGG